MTKRNEPCPCGSGVKYKNCCLSKGRRRVVRVDAQTHLLALLSQHRKSVLATVELAERAVIESLEQDETALEIRSRESNDPTAILRNQAELIECGCVVIARLVDECLETVRHSKLFWFLLFRRLTPTILRTVLSQSGSGAKDSREEVEYTATVSEILALLTGLILDSDTLFTAVESICKAGVSGIDFSSVGVGELRIVGAVVSYAIQIQQYRVAFRLINKGVPLTAIESTTPSTSNADRSAVQDYERRRRLYSTVTGFSGVWFDPASLSPRGGSWTEWAMIRMAFPRGLRFQVEGDDKVLSSPWLVADYVEERHLPNIASLSPIPLHIIPGDKGGAMCGLPLKAIFATIPDEFFIDCFRDELSDFMFAVYLVLRNWLDFSALSHSAESPGGVNVVPRSAVRSLETFQANWSDVASLGVMRGSEAEWLRELWRALCEVWSSEGCMPTMSQSRLRELLTLFTRRQGRPAWSNEPFLFIRPAEGTVALDLLRLGDFLIDILAGFNRLGRDVTLRLGDPVGPLFEASTRSYLLRSLGVSRDSALVARELVNGDLRREVDLAFVYKRCLLVFDCKAKPHDGEYMQGKHAQIRNNLSEYRKEFAKNRERIDLIRRGAAAVISATSFDRAESFVCTPTVEYLPFGEPDFWAGAHARVGPPEELIATIAYLTECATLGSTMTRPFGSGGQVI